MSNTGYAIKTNGTFWVWGSNTYGVLGLNQPGPSHRSSPTQLGTETTWSDVSGTAKEKSFALKTDGTFWSWGYNNKGELGLNNTIKYSSPVQVGTDTTWSKVASYKTNSLGLKTDGTLWSWGYNLLGGLGLNDTVQRSSPTQIPGTWSNISSGTPSDNNQGIAQKSDGTLWAWGENQRGFLGQNQAPSPTTSRSSPVQVSGTTWDVAQMAQKKIIATKTDGSIWSWGYNAQGSAGLNNEVQNSSPTQIGTDTNWIATSFRGGRNATIIMRS